MDNRKKQKQIHRNGAELKWKVPPVVASAAENESQSPLFPDLACRHHKPCIKKKAFRTVQRPETSHTTFLLPFSYEFILK